MATREGSDGGGGTPGEDALHGTLTRVGPLLRRRAESDAPDPAFVARLRARLLATETTPDPTFVRVLRSHLLGTAQGCGAAGERRWGRAVTGIVLAVVVLGLLVVAAVALVWLDLAVIALVAVVVLAVIIGRRRR